MLSSLKTEMVNVRRCHIWIGFGVKRKLGLGCGSDTIGHVIQYEVNIGSKKMFVQQNKKLLKAVIFFM